MKASELPAEEELHRLIVARYGNAVSAASGPGIRFKFHVGTKPYAPWKRDALFAVNDLRAEGASITDALRGVYRNHDIERLGGSSFDTFKRSYEKFRRGDLRQHFYASVLEGDIAEAIVTLRFCHDDVREEIWRDLNRDKPPPQAD